MALMNATYNLSALAESETVLDVVTVANNATGQILMGLFLVAVFFIMMMILSKNGFDNALVISSFACFILSLFLRFANMINFLFVIFFLAITAFMLFYMVVVKRRITP